MRQLTAPDSLTPDEMKLGLTALCGGVARVAAYVSVGLQKREGVVPHRDRLPNLALLTEDERRQIEAGWIPETLR